MFVVQLYEKVPVERLCKNKPWLGPVSNGEGRGGEQVGGFRRIMVHTSFLPDELWVHMLSSGFFTPRELGRASQSCRSLAVLAAEASQLALSALEGALYGGGCSRPAADPSSASALRTLALGPGAVHWRPLFAGGGGGCGGGGDQGWIQPRIPGL